MEAAHKFTDPNPVRGLSSWENHNEGTEETSVLHYELDGFEFEVSLDLLASDPDTQVQVRVTSKPVYYRPQFEATDLQPKIDKVTEDARTQWHERRAQYGERHFA